MIAHRRGRVIIIDETARRPIRLVPRKTAMSEVVVFKVTITGKLGPGAEKEII